MLEDIEIVNAYFCTECEKAIAESSVEPLYACPECNRKAKGEEGRRCADCRKFCKKIAADSCSECDEGEVEECEAIECPACSELIEVDSFAEHASDCGAIADEVRTAWAERQIELIEAEVPISFAGKFSVEVVAAVECPCGETVGMGEFAEHASTCTDSTGDNDEVSEAIEKAIMAARERFVKANAKPEAPHA